MVRFTSVRDAFGGRVRVVLAVAFTIAALTVAGSVSRAAGTTNGWSATASMATARAGVIATPLRDGRVLVVGGAAAELYDPASATWSSAGVLHRPRLGEVAVRLPDGRVLVAGGQYSPAPSSTTQRPTPGRSREA
jgi:hypothetical protein